MGADYYAKLAWVYPTKDFITEPTPEGDPRKFCGVEVPHTPYNDPWMDVYEFIQSLGLESFSDDGDQDNYNLYPRYFGLQVAECWRKNYGQRATPVSADDEYKAEVKLRRMIGQMTGTDTLPQRYLFLSCD